VLWKSPRRRPSIQPYRTAVTESAHGVRSRKSTNRVPWSYFPR
jgi:hypothetical protein